MLLRGSEAYLFPFPCHLNFFINCLSCPQLLQLLISFKHFFFNAAKALKGSYHTLVKLWNQTGKSLNVATRPAYSR